MLAAIAARSIERAVIITGDTNPRVGRAPSSGQAPSDGAILARLLGAAGLADACAVVQSSVCDQHIDRILYRPDGDLTLQAIDWYVDERFRDADGDPLSDHPAIAMKFMWAGQPAPARLGAR